MKRIEITVDKNGESKVEAFGFAGKGCMEATREIEAALGGVSEDVKKPEFRQGRNAQQVQKAGQ